MESFICCGHKMTLVREEDVYFEVCLFCGEENRNLFIPDPEDCLSDDMICE